MGGRAGKDLIQGSRPAQAPSSLCLVSQEGTEAGNTSSQAKAEVREIVTLERVSAWSGPSGGRRGPAWWGLVSVAQSSSLGQKELSPAD